MSQLKDNQERQAALSSAKKALLDKWKRGKAVGEEAQAQYIPARDRQKACPLSFAQQQLWFLDQLEPGNAFYNGSVVLTLAGHLQRSALEQSITSLVERHESLRTVFCVQEDQPVQIVKLAELPCLSFVDLSVQGEEDVQRFVQDEVRYPFDLAQGPLCRVTLIRLSTEMHLLLLVMHHIISDGWSETVLLNELATCYNAFCAGKPSPLKPLPIQAADFAAWERSGSQDEVFARQLSYWKQQLASMPTKIDLPTDHPRPAMQTYCGARQSLVLSPELHKQLKLLGKQEGATLFMTLLAAFSTLLFRYTGQTDIAVGTPIANRNRPELEGMIGLFLNTLVIRSVLSSELTFREMLQNTRRIVREALAHQDISFEAIVAEIQPERTLSHNALFQVLFVLQEIADDLPAMNDLTLARGSVDTGTAKFDITLEMVETGKSLEACIEYNTDLFHKDTIIRLLEHWQTLLQAIVAQPDRSLAAFSILPEAEYTQMLTTWNNTRTHYTAPACLPALIEAQVVASPERVGLAFEDAQLTYEELDRRSTLLAGYLQQRGIGADGLVGICVERSIEMVIGLLGILKANGAYVPFDPAYPAERLRFMLEDSRVPLILTQQRLCDALPFPPERMLCLDTAWESICDVGNAHEVRREVQPDNLAYMIYTSGSTGTPKGAMNTHRAICNRLLWMQEEYQLGADDTVLQKTPFSFDVSVWEFFWPLLAGARLVLAIPDGHRDSQYLSQLLVEQGVTTLHFVPSMLQVFLEAQGVEACTGVRRVICSGEALPFEIQPRFFARLNAALYNLYGPTEAAIDVTAWTCSPDYEGSSIPMGRPIANTEIYILDTRFQPVPVGCIGELYIGGVNLARGYLDRPGLTAERFVPHPFSAESGVRLYRTGDLARFLPDGNVVYAGRIDHQVKVRGFRIELGEIERILSQYPTVRECLVAVREEKTSEKRLVAYIVLTQGESLETGQLRKYLQDKLPEYMVPALFVLLDAFPLMPNGKIDHRALSHMDITRPDPAETFVAPRTSIEQTLVQLWAETLRLKDVGVRDNFFELGGDSILCMQIVARAKQAGIYLTPKQFFRYQTIEELSQVADTSRASTMLAEQGIVTGPVPLTPIQHWFFALQLPVPQHWNQFMLLEMQQPVDVVLLDMAFQVLLEHHDALRLSFEYTGEDWSQSCGSVTSHVPFLDVDLSRLSSAMQWGAMQEVEEREQEQIRLDQDVLARAVLFDLGSRGKQRLLIIIHHLAVDGVSWRILLEDLQTAYEHLERGESPQLPPKTTSFQQWARQLLPYARSSQLQEEQHYWLSDAYSRKLPWPVDYQESSQRNIVASVKKVTVSLNVQETREMLEDVPQIYHTQINDILLTALLLTLSEWTKSPRLRLDLEGHGREDLFADVDLSRTVGWFTSLFPLILDISGARTEIEALKCVKEQLRCIPNRGVGYGILRYLSRDAAITEQFQALPASPLIFNYLGQFEESSVASRLFGLQLQSSGLSQAQQGPRPYLLEINSFISQGQLQMSWEYSEPHYRVSTMRYLASRFMVKLRILIQQCRSLESRNYTPDDFPEVELTQEQLAAVFDELDLGE